MTSKRKIPSSWNHHQDQHDPSNKKEWQTFKMRDNQQTLFRKWEIQLIPCAYFNPVASMSASERRKKHRGKEINKTKNKRAKKHTKHRFMNSEMHKTKSCCR